MTTTFDVLADPTALDLLLSLERRGVLISLADDKTLRVRGEIRADDIQALREHKAGVLRLVHYVDQLLVM
jgi:tRNA threonylcarbamoyladenosine modification (KEOPS) complex  Pcc1 subunit